MKIEYAGVAGILLLMNGKLTIWKMKHHVLWVVFIYLLCSLTKTIDAFKCLWLINIINISSSQVGLT
jgi:hypothetical protein